MKHQEYQYLDIMKKIMDEGKEHKNRTGITTKRLLCEVMKYDLSKEFPLLTTKKVYWKGILHELLWFLRGDTNIKYLQDNNVHIWDANADEDGNLGPIYGKQWISWFNTYVVNERKFDYEKPEIKTEFNKRVKLNTNINTCELIGKKFNSKTGDYIVINEVEKNKKTLFNIKFLKTGYIQHEVTKQSVLNGTVKDRYYPSVCSVGCLGENLNEEKTNKIYKELYQTWVAMLKRCYNEKHVGYGNYGGKGVFVDRRWLIFSNFYKDVQSIDSWILKKQFPKNYSLDKDFLRSNKYSKETCIWSNKEEQSINNDISSSFIAINKSGERTITKGNKFFCRRYGLTSQVVSQCLNGKYKQHKGWSFEKLNDPKIRIRVFNQIEMAIANIIHNPESRRIIISAWNPSEIKMMRLAPCHVMSHFTVDDDKLHCTIVQRSADVLLGIPFNIASYALLTCMMAHICGLKPGTLNHVMNDAHIYENHFEQVKEQLSRKPYDLPTLKLNKDIKNIFDFKYHDIEIIGYKCHPAIKAEMAV